MGRRKRAHKGVATDDAEDPNAAKVPRTFVTKQGKVGKSVRQLVLDTRRMFEPNTATRLRVSARNQLRDFVSVAGPLGVTHLVSLTSTDTATNLRIARLPRGPTLTFRVDAYSLVGEVIAAQRRAETPSREFLHAPLAILNGFAGSSSRAVSLTAVVLQSIFPMLNVQTVKLSEAKRVVFFAYDAESDTIELRHYLVRTAPVGVSRSMRTLTASSLPDLHQFRDISEFVLAADTSSDAESDDGGTFAQVETGRASASSTARASARGAAKHAIKLREIGPRMRLSLLKIEEGCHAGKVLHHRFISLSDEEIALRQRKAEARAALHAQRKAEQRRNVERKRATAAAGEAEDAAEHDAHGRDERAPRRADDDDSMDEEDYYREAVGEAPDPELFTKGTTGGGKARGYVPNKWLKRKRPSESGDGREPAFKRPRA